MLTKKEKDSLYKYSEQIAKKYIRYYKGIYRNKVLDYDDIKQEAYIVVWKVLKKFENTKSFSDLKRLISNAVGDRLNILRIKCKSFKGIASFSNSIEENDDEEKDSEETLSNSEYTDEVITENRGIDSYKLQITMEEVKKLCELPEIKKFFGTSIRKNPDSFYTDNSKILYLLIQRYFVEGFSCKEIGKEFDLSDAGVSRLIKKLLRLLKKYYFK